MVRDAIFLRGLLYKTPTAGVLMPPVGRNAGRSSHNGSGTCAWSWAISLSLLPCAPPSLLQPFQRRLSARLPPLATLLPRLACPGKPGASRGATLLLKLMAPCAALLASRCTRPNSAEKPMAPCGCFMPPGLEIVVPVDCASSVSGTGVARKSRVGSAC
jgi:hypothetical protein